MGKFLLLVFILIASLTSCTDNSRSRNYGGTETVDLRKNEVFVNMSWKQDNLWIITKDTVTGISYGREKSSFGMLEGTIIIK